MLRSLVVALRSPSPVLLSYAGALLLFVLVSLYSPGFASPSHVSTLIIVASFTGIVAIGQTMVIVGGGIDLSVPWMLNCAAVMTTALTRSDDTAHLWAVPLILVSGAAVGSVNGIGIDTSSIPSSGMCFKRKDSYSAEFHRMASSWR